MRSMCFGHICVTLVPMHGTVYDWQKDLQQLPQVPAHLSDWQIRHRFSRPGRRWRRARAARAREGARWRFLDVLTVVTEFPRSWLGDGSRVAL